MAISDLKRLPTGADTGCVLSTRLRQLIHVTTGCLQKLLAAMMSLAPHSMPVSHYNNIRSSHRLAMSLDTVNDRLAISLNGVGTAQFGPRPYVAKFLTDKERREGTLTRISTPTDFTRTSFFVQAVNCNVVTGLYIVLDSGLWICLLFCLSWTFSDLL
jgi:hypothetical protein